MSTSQLLEASASIARARALTPGRYDYAFIQAQILARRGEFADARAVLGPLMTGAYAPPGVRDSARSLMGIARGNGEPASHRCSSADPRPASAVIRIAVRPCARFRIPNQAATLTGADVHPGVPSCGSWRAAVRGHLRADRLPAGGLAVFRHERPSAPAQLEASRLGDVDLISYRDDLRGGVRCGSVGGADARLYHLARGRPGAAREDRRCG